MKTHYFVNNDHFEHTLASKDWFRFRPVPVHTSSGSYQFRFIPVPVHMDYGFRFRFRFTGFLLIGSAQLPPSCFLLPSSFSIDAHLHRSYALLSMLCSLFVGNDAQRMWRWFQSSPAVTADSAEIGGDQTWRVDAVGQPRRRSLAP